MPYYTIAKSGLNLPQINLNGVPMRYINPGELEVIVGLMQSVKPKRVLETGINVGRTAKVILDNVPGVESYVGVDVQAGYVTEKKCQRKEVPVRPGEMVLDRDGVKLLVMKNGSHDLSAADIGPLDAAFIDGDHSARGVIQDTRLFLKCARPGAICVWHDDNGLPVVDVSQTLMRFSDFGWMIEHVRDTWVSYMRLPKPDFARAVMLEQLDQVAAIRKAA